MTTTNANTTSCDAKVDEKLVSEEVLIEIMKAVKLLSSRDYKILFPSFSGDNPEGWILQAEKYFTLCHSTDTEKVELACISMTGEALIWFQREDSQQVIRSWEELKKKLLKQFQINSEANLAYEGLMSLRQEGTVAQYRTEFEKLIVPIQGCPRVLLEAAFINGLRSDIRSQVKLSGTTGLVQVMQTALIFEDKNSVASA